jgi:hypothetical protein
MRVVTSGLPEEICFEGSGEIQIPSSSRFWFLMHGRPEKNSNWIQLLRRAKDDPGNIHAQLKLEVTDYRGTQWNCGYIDPHIGEEVSGVFRITGDVYRLITGIDGWQVDRKSSVEIVYERELRLPIPMNMTKPVYRDGHEVLLTRQAGGKKIQVLGTEVEIFHDASRDVLWATAETSAFLNHPYAENWLSEPLCMLLGELVFPRLVARNLGNGSAMVSVERAPGKEARSLFASILEKDPHFAGEEFWALYQELLVVVAMSRNEKGELNFEANPLTHFYHEIIQSSDSTNWMMCLTLSSVAEGIVKLIIPQEKWRSDFKERELTNMREYISAWSGDKNVRGRMLESVGFLSKRGVASLLNGLANEAGFEKAHVNAWRSVRNHVMHGNLVPPWFDDELEVQMRLLAELTHKLAKLYVRRFIAAEWSQAELPSPT